MFEVNLVKTCGDILSLALEESLGKGSVAVIGPSVKEMKFLDWKPTKFTDPMELNDTADYDFIICIQCLGSLKGIKLINIDNKLYAVKGNKLVDLTKDQSRQAHAFMKHANLKLLRGSSAVLPLELHNFLGKAEKALKAKGQILFIDSGSSNIFNNLTLMKTKPSSFSRFLATTGAGKLHVVNSNPFLANSPHITRDSVALDVLTQHKHVNKLVPWLDLEKELSTEEKLVIEPFITRVSSVFSEWGNTVKDYKTVANRVKKRLQDENGLTELYSTFFVLEGDVPKGFSEKAWFRANELSNLPARPDFFASLLSKQ